jgi:hypothetical protein
MMQGTIGAVIDAFSNTERFRLGHVQGAKQMNRINRLPIVILFALIANLSLKAQTIADEEKISNPPQKDLMDVIRSIFKTKAPEQVPTSKPSVSFLPVIGYNPSFGGIIGFNTVMGKQLGDPANTDYSVFNLLVNYSSTGVVTIQSRHNIFRPENRWNFQGNWQFSLYGLVDHGLGTGKTDFCEVLKNDSGNHTFENDSIFPIRYHYLRLSEKAFYQVIPDLYFGAGINLNFYSKIDDLDFSDTTSTPHSRYSQTHGFSSNKYAVNGIEIVFQYNNRDHPIRSYRGFYFDLALQFNPTWLGSTKNSSSISYDIRKFWPLSKRNPTHVLAFWHWANYHLSGVRPYLNLPYTGSDTYNRSGRGYTIGYFRGPSYAYFETEYRYPILRNKLMSGVVFMNLQSAGNDVGTKVYEQWNMGGGVGLRFLFQKRSRTTVCVDFSKGNCGSEGIFFGLNEVF